ncbi:phage lysin protein endolysin [Striga asiatica]|uniref:Phage lysin protein endolysin n=1 Tax=Striga asiatica TaxID=4170 RepID=A0A5A7QI13_STRAF|nr:phage lysin protein endolysin [Striga asiatica]
MLSALCFHRRCTPRGHRLVFPVQAAISGSRQRLSGALSEGVEKRNEIREFEEGKRRIWEEERIGNLRTATKSVGHDDTAFTARSRHNSPATPPQPPQTRRIFNTYPIDRRPSPSPTSSLPPPPRLSQVARLPRRDEVMCRAVQAYRAAREAPTAPCWDGLPRRDGFLAVGTC